MKRIKISDVLLTDGASIRGKNGSDMVLALSKKGAGLDVTWLKDIKERYLYFWIKGNTLHSVPFTMLVFNSREKSDEPVFDIRTGVLPGVRTGICIDTTWFDAHALFPETCPGQLKITCHGRRVERDEMSRILLQTLPLDEDIEIELSDLYLTDEYPESEIPSDGSALPDTKFIDEMGQNRISDWNGKKHSLEEMKELLLRQDSEAGEGYPFADWTKWGGWKEMKLTQGSGFFGKIKKNGRWWLTDPDGYAFFSTGPDCVAARDDCRIDGIEKWMEWLPDRDDPVYGSMYSENRKWPMSGDSRRTCILFSFEKANLYRTFGDNWYEKWKHMVTGQLKRHGMNTLGNWSDEKLFGVTDIPYVTSLPAFPDTSSHIFRDFPDVFSKEYRENAEKCAEALRLRKDDPWMIGYFLRNEPAWAFVDNLVLADEVLYNPERTCCKEKLISRLKEKYSSAEALNAAWNTSYESFDELYESQTRISERTAASAADMKAFSVDMLKAYIGIPSEMCRKADPNHMILGMRWAWISDPDVVTGWENFDVFSINCYSFDPSPAIENVRKLGVDLPVMIGEFHFGALDAGPFSTGLEAVRSQSDRGQAYRYYCERTAAHPCGVGCHYFQCYDQFALGRFDGENYNIGLFDICSTPYAEMMEAVKLCSSRIYRIAASEEKSCENKPEKTSMIAF